MCAGGVWRSASYGAFRFDGASTYELDSPELTLVSSAERLDLRPDENVREIMRPARV